MKNILSLSAAIILSCVLFAQNPAISKKYSDGEIAILIQKYKHSPNHDVAPTDALLQKFQRDFSNAHNVEWESNDEIYEAEFDIQFREFAAYYDKEGNLLMYKQDIQENELPADIKTAATTKYPAYRFEDIQKIVKGTEVFYEIELELNESEVTMLVTSTGKVISETIDK
jgi:hypothetical protein